MRHDSSARPGCGRRGWPVDSTRRSPGVTPSRHQVHSVQVRYPATCTVVLLQHDVRRIGKLMLFGAVFRCLDPALTIAGSSKAISFLLLPLTSRVSPLLLCSMKMHALGLLITMHCVFFLSCKIIACGKRVKNETRSL